MSGSIRPYIDGFDWLVPVAMVYIVSFGWMIQAVVLNRENPEYLCRLITILLPNNDLQTSEH